MADKKKEEEKVGYQSKYKSQLDDVTDRILNREKFSYNLNGDAFYNQYKDRFTQQGKMAMMDTMGQAAALTGGYGNSYAQQVGQQTYQGHLQGLNDVVPELYQLALDSYNREGDALLNEHSMLADMDAQEYSRHRDQVADQQADQKRDDARDKLDYENSLAAAMLMAEAGDYSRLAEIYGLDSNEVSTLLENGDKLDGEDLNEPGSLPDATETDNTRKFVDGLMTLEQALSRGITKREYVAMVSDKINNSDLTDGEVRWLLQYYGLD